MLIERVVAPGAQILLKSIEPYDPELTPSTLSTEQWVKLADAFHEWPFKPDVLEDETFIKDDLVEDFQNTRLFPVGIPEGVFSSVDEGEEEEEEEEDDDLEEEIFEEHEKQ
jgi:hypothetical protein